MAELLKGKPVADRMTQELAAEAAALRALGIAPRLAIVRVGARQDDLAYERGALKRCETIGIETIVVALPRDIPQAAFIEAFGQVNADHAVHGILLFRPLPEQLDEEVLKHVIAPEKDIDCFSPVNVAKLAEGDATGFPPCTPTAVMEILRHYRVPMRGKKAVVLGRSMVVGKPAAMLLLSEDATVTVCHSKTANLPEEAARADILVAAIGRAKIVKADWVKPGAAVIDVGINQDGNGDMCGDVDFDAVVEKAGMITPVPGGVGAVTTSVLAKHVVKACKLQNGIR